MNSPTDRPMTDDGLINIPWSLDTEQAVIGSVLLAGGEVLDMLEQPLVEDDFFPTRHRLLWRAVLNLTRQDRPVDVITVTEWLRDHDKLDEVEGMEYVAELTLGAPPPANVDAYAEVLRHLSVRRKGFRVGNEIVRLAMGAESESAEDFAAQAEQMVAALSAGTVGGWEHISEVAARQMETVDELVNGDHSMVGLSTGFDELDRRTLGLQPGDLIILGARPSMGKTQLAVDIMSKVLAAGGSAGFFSLEMPSEQIFTRLAAGRSTVQLMRLRQGNLSESEQDRFFAEGAKLANAHCWLDPTPNLSGPELRRRARQLASRARAAGSPLQLLVVDYLQLMEGSSQGHNRTNDVGEISRSLKATARELNVPVLALSQLNRGLESRPDKRPKMSDLRESGAIEQDADVIMFLYREVVYDESADPSAAEVNVAKQRNGPTGVANLRWVPNVPRFAN